MRRTALLFLFCIFMPAGLLAQPAGAQTATGFDSALAASVWSSALSYIAPRALQPVTLPQMTLWGLNGLATLDPDLTATLQNGELRLYGPDALLKAVPAPADTDATGWGNAAAQISLAAYAASPALRQAGTAEIIANFFDELFNHFDPYSRYESPLQAAQEQLVITGLASTGLSFAPQGGHVAIANVATESPAESAGLTPGEIVLSVDGQAVAPADAASLNNQMNGVTGSSIVLRVLDPQDDSHAVQSVTLTRAAVPPQTVTTAPGPAPGVALIRISGFNKGTSDQFSTALAAIMSQSPAPDALIIDLRGNRGGVLRQAVLVADSLLTSGAIVSTQGRDPDASQTFTAEGADLTQGARIAVLVDGRTASAAEILAAALSDNRRAVVIGSETLGKGLVQTLTALPDGGELFVTWSRVLAPRGWPLQNMGVMPQICTSLGDDTTGQELSALAGGQNLLGPVLAAARAVRAPVNLDTILAIRNNCPADIGSDLDVTAAAAVLQSPTAYQAALLPAP